MLEHIFSVKNCNNTIVLYIFFIKITIKTANYYLDTLLQAIRSTNETTQANIESVKGTVQTNTESVKNSIKEQYLNLNNSIQDFVKNNNHKILPYYTFDFCEEWFGKENFACFNGDIKQKYLDLIRGLDKTSVKLIDKTICRIQDFTMSGNRQHVLTDEELKDYKAIQDNLSIVKLSDDCWVCNNYILPIQYFETSIFYYKHFIHELKNIDYFKDKNILDIGGYVGDSALILSEYTNKSVYSFEPLTESYNMLNRTIKLNNKTNIIPVKCGIGSSVSQAEITTKIYESTILEREYYSKQNLSKEIIDINTVDNFVNENNLIVGLIKVDIEGYEQEFLKGAENTIKTQKPTLLISIYHSADDYFNIKPIIENWDLGYKFKIVKPFQGQVINETMLLAEI